MAGLPVIRLHDCRHTAVTIMVSHGIPPIIVAGATCPNFGRVTCLVFGRMLGNSLAILMTTYAHLARFARYVRDFPGTQDEPLGFASLASAARLMDEILTPIPIEIRWLIV